MMTKGENGKSSRLVFPLLAIVFLAALMIRTEYVRGSSDTVPIIRDARQYLAYGYNLAHHGVFSKDAETSPPTPDSFRSPGYPLLVAWSFLVGDERTFYPILMHTQAILGSLTVPLTFFLGTCFLPPRAAFAAALLVAFSPHMIVMTGYMLTETLFSFLLLSSMLCFQYALRYRHTFLFAGAGFLFACLYLTNEAVLFIPFLLGFLPLALGRIGISRSETRPLLPKIMMFLIIFSFFPAGWALRNHISLPPDAAKGSNRAIRTMCHGSYPNFIYKDPKFRRFPYREDPMQPAFSSSFGNFRSILWKRFKEEPIRYLKWYFLGKPYHLWSWDIIQGVGDVYVYPVRNSLFETSMLAGLTKESMKSLHPLILIFALMGIALAGMGYPHERTGKGISDTPFPLLAVLFYFTLLYMVFAPLPRYSVPLRPELYLWAVWAFVAGKTFVRKKSAKRSP